MPDDRLALALALEAYLKQQSYHWGRSCLRGLLVEGKGEISPAAIESYARKGVEAEARCFLEGLLRFLRDLSPYQERAKSMEGAGIRVLFYREAAYPSRLYSLASPPTHLYLRGKKWQEVLHNPLCITVVGSRKPTLSGRLTCREFASALGAAGVPVISGFALGIDGEAHQACLEAGCPSLGILATGPDRCYPPAHRDLYSRMMEEGGFLTELPPGTPPKKNYFPARNRLLAALSPLTLVIEAGLGSGSLISARQACELNREVFAVPGNISSPQSYGSNLLLQEGAHIALRVEDVLEPLLNDVGYTLDRKEGAFQRLRAGYRSRTGGLFQGKRALTASEKRLLEEIASACDVADALEQATGMDLLDLMAKLTDLECRGLIFSQMGRYAVTDMGRMALQ